jgi:hypothetical protein
MMQSYATTPDNTQSHHNQDPVLGSMKARRQYAFGTSHHLLEAIADEIERNSKASAKLLDMANLDKTTYFNPNTAYRHVLAKYAELEAAEINLNDDDISRGQINYSNEVLDTKSSPSIERVQNQTDEQIDTEFVSITNPILDQARRDIARHASTTEENNHVIQETARL